MVPLLKKLYTCTMNYTFSPWENICLRKVLFDWDDFCPHTNNVLFYFMKRSITEPIISVKVIRDGLQNLPNSIIKLKSYG